MERRQLAVSDIVIGSPDMIVGVDQAAEGGEDSVTMIVDRDTHNALVSVDKDGGYCFACPETKFFPGNEVIKHYFSEHCK